MTSTRRLSSKAGVTIPKEMRLTLGWQPGIAVDLETTSDGAILIKPHSPRCRFCGAYENVHKYKDITICPECANKMKEAI